MAEGKRDGNRVVATIGSFNGVPVPLKVEHATQYLKVSPTFAAFDAPTVSNTKSGRDGNRVTSATGSFNGAIRTVKVTNADGYLRAVNNA